MIRKIRRDAQITAHTEQRGDKDYIVTLDMQDVFSVQMNVVSESQASLLEQNFKKHAESIYQELLSTLTRNYDEE